LRAVVELGEVCHRRWGKCSKGGDQKVKMEGEKDKTSAKRDKALGKASEKLLLIMTLLVIGIDREAQKTEKPSTSPASDQSGNSTTKGITSTTTAPQSASTAASSPPSSVPSSALPVSTKKDSQYYTDTTKSMLKILFDYVNRHCYGDANDAARMASLSKQTIGGGTGGTNQQQQQQSQNSLLQDKQKQKEAAEAEEELLSKLSPKALSKRRKHQQQQQQQLANIPSIGISASTINLDGRKKKNFTLSSRTMTPLQSIGDVFHRTRNFLADMETYAQRPEMSMLLNEIIGLLCDVLDIDTEMELSEEGEGQSGEGSGGAKLKMSGGKGERVINELGSAGGLLKLIVRNCASYSKEVAIHAVVNTDGGAAVAATKDSADNDSIIDKDALASPSVFNENAAAAAAAFNGGPKSSDEDTAVPKPSKKTTTAAVTLCCGGNRFLAVVHRLAASRSISARVTACNLGPVLWGHLDFPHQLQLRGVITRALHDVEVLVRKSTAAVLHEIAELVFDPKSVPWLVLMCERAMTDPEPQLRAVAMTLTWHLAEHLPNAFMGDASKGSRSLSRLPSRSDPLFVELYLLQCKLLPVATRLAEDRSPSVRLAVAAQCDRLSTALGEHWFSVIIDLLQALLGDGDDRVRSEATVCLPRLVESVLIGSSSDSCSGVLESLLPLAIKLLKDPSAIVRCSLAISAGELLTLLVGLGSQDGDESLPTINGGDDSTGISNDGYKRHKRHIDETLIPLVQRLLHDADPEVTSAALRAVTNASRGNARDINTKRKKDFSSASASSPNRTPTSKKDPVFVPVLSESQVLRLLPTLSDLATSSQWRVRQSAVEIVPALLGCTHRLETRSRIAQLCVQLMGDTVDAVRRTAAECLCLGGGSLGGDGGGEWILAIVIPNLRVCRDSTTYRQRLLCLKMVESVVGNGYCEIPDTPSAPKALDYDTGKASSGDPLSSASPLRMIIEVAASLSDDKVVNVRLNVGRVLGDIVGSLTDKNDVRFIAQVLEKQLASEVDRERCDRDVVYFARRGIAAANRYLNNPVLI